MLDRGEDARRDRPLWWPVPEPPHEAIAAFELLEYVRCPCVDDSRPNSSLFGQRQPPIRIGLGYAVRLDNMVRLNGNSQHSGILRGKAHPGATRCKSASSYR
jgi:hypothetical protein